MKNQLLGILLALLLVIGLTMPAFAHGAKIEYTISMTVEIRAVYDTGEPMGGGQVTVYAPGDPTTPWLTGVCDEEGRFTFTPDPSQPGTWDVQVRQSGHGDMVHIPIGEEVAMARGFGYTPLQIVLMGVCVVWGFVGTALFFSRSRAGGPDAHS
ncbi:MAG: carboxypeptidase-like regulatory domain-containing protein [Chloroflexota bacterium]|nr:carboxypeptidase-like regulatory domain-containing protein [Chloroflexota bacterium]